VSILSVLICYFIYTPQECKGKVTNKREDFLIRVGCWPRCLPEWNAKFQIINGRWIESDEWDYPIGQWEPVEGDGLVFRRDDGALRVRSEGVGVRKGVKQARTFCLKQASAFYDFNLEFRVKIAMGNSARWILRADPVEETWYQFELVKDASNHVSLHGYAYSNLNERRELENSPQSIPFDECCKETDIFNVRARIEGYEFQYWFYLNSFERGEERTTLGPNFEKPVGVINDNNDHWYRFGNVGLRGMNDSQSLFYFWHVTPLQTTSQP
jgi:hypothetical protein